MTSIHLKPDWGEALTTAYWALRDLRMHDNTSDEERGRVDLLLVELDSISRRRKERHLDRSFVLTARGNRRRA